MARRRKTSTSCDYAPQGSFFQCQTCGDLAAQPRQRECPNKYDPDSDPEIGVGNELARLLHRFGIHPQKGCSCEELRKELNALGPDGCDERIDEIARRLQQQAVKRNAAFAGTPVTRFIAKRVVAHAIRTARQAMLDRQAAT